MPLTHPTPDARYFRELLARRSSQPGLSTVIDDEIVAKFQRRIALLVLDMCGFTERTSRYGIIHYLSLIERMEATARPVVEQNAGTVIKRQADNLYAAFSHPQQAIEAALEIYRSFDALNQTAPEEHKIDGCIGIGFGDILLVGGTDVFGQEVNLTCKLGEDVAKRREILITQGAFSSLVPGQYRMQSRLVQLGGIEVQAYSFEKRLAGPLGSMV